MQMLKAARTGKRFDIEAATAQMERALREIGPETIPLSDYCFGCKDLDRRLPSPSDRRRPSLVTSFLTNFAKSFSSSIASFSHCMDRSENHAFSCGVVAVAAISAQRDLVALDSERVELANQVAEYDCAVARHFPIQSSC